jgi:hypothetical protein
MASLFESTAGSFFPAHPIRIKNLRVLRALAVQIFLGSTFFLLTARFAQDAKFARIIFLQKHPPIHGLIL